MENKLTGRSFLPIVLTFILVSVLALAVPSMLAAWKVDHAVLLGGNGLLFLLTAVSFYLYARGLRNDNVQAFLRVMYGSMLIKFVGCLLAVLIYALVSRQGVNRNGIFGCLIVYMLYTFLEVRALLQLSKSKKVTKNA
jgi:uncharacterized membrane protein YfcA